jgi:NAD(P)-dependent dehydrogenase (short-subunit alcohol dehydrogenase family)
MEEPGMCQEGSSGKRALLTGATGLIAAKLARRLADAVVLSHDPERARPKLGAGEAHAWSPEEGPPPAAALAKRGGSFPSAGRPEHSR